MAFKLLPGTEKQFEQLRTLTETASPWNWDRLTDNGHFSFQAPSNTRTSSASGRAASSSR